MGTSDLSVCLSKKSPLTLKWPSSVDKQYHILIPSKLGATSVTAAGRTTGTVLSMSSLQFQLAPAALVSAAGKVSIRLPFPPGVEYDYMAEPPPGSLPVSFNSSFEVTDTTLTHAEYILSDKLTGVETVAVARDGRLGIVDKFGRVRVTGDRTCRHTQGLLWWWHSPVAEQRRIC